MKVKLVVKSGARKKNLDIRLPTVIGRSRDAELNVRNTQVSRKHCEIYEEDDQLWVRDLGSANGTFVNKERIAGKAPLADGDVLNVGPVAMRAVVETRGGSSVVDHGEIQLDEVGSATSEPDAPGLSDLDYEETPDGSFIGITDDNETEPMGKPAAKDPAPVKKKKRKKKQAPAKANVTEDRTEVVRLADETVQEVVKSEDSALNDFFSGLN